MSTNPYTPPQIESDQVHEIQLTAVVKRISRVLLWVAFVLGGFVLAWALVAAVLRRPCTLTYEQNVEQMKRVGVNVEE